jgi:hypothetical protein
MVGIVYDFTSAAELLHGEEKVVYCDDSYQGMAKRPEMATYSAPKTAARSRCWQP